MFSLQDKIQMQSALGPLPSVRLTLSLQAHCPPHHHMIGTWFFLHVLVIQAGDIPSPQLQNSTLNNIPTLQMPGSFSNAAELMILSSEIGTC